MTSPTLKRYSQLTKEQHEAISFIEGRLSGGLWQDCGTGKTVVLLTALQRLIDRYDVRRVLVVGPRLVAERVWSTEVAEWGHLNSLRVARVVGTVAQRNRALEEEADVYTITRDNVVWLHNQYVRRDEAVRKWVQYKRFPFDVIVLDESQSFKTQGSQRSKAIRRLRKLVRRCYLASGSFIPNGYRDAWHQAFLIDGGEALGKTEKGFLDRYFTMRMHDGFPLYEIRKEAPKEIDERLATILHIVRDAQPPVPCNFVQIELSKEEHRAYLRMARKSVLDIGTQKITAVNAGVLYGKLLQLANGAVYDESHKWHVVHSRKIEALAELLETLPRPVLIGYSFVHDIERIQPALVAAGIKGASVLRTGASLDAWRRGDIAIGLLHPATAGHGLNDLYASDCRHLVWFGFTANREYYDQLNGRLIGGHRRTGRSVVIHHLVAQGTIDEEAQALLELKGEQQLTAQIRILEKLQENLDGKTEPGEVGAASAHAGCELPRP